VANPPKPKAHWLIAALSGPLLLSNCTQNTGTSTDTLMDTNPSAVCASADTMSGMANVVLGNLDTSTYNPPLNPSYKNELQAETKVTVDTVVLDSFDKTTRKVSCSGKLTFNWPNAIVAKLKAIQPAVNWGVDTSESDFTVQPDAHGADFVYSMDNQSFGAMQGSIQVMLSTLAKADADAVAAAAANAAASKAPAPPSPDSNATPDESQQQSQPTSGDANGASPN